MTKLGLQAGIVVLGFLFLIALVSGFLWILYGIFIAVPAAMLIVTFDLTNSQGVNIVIVLYVVVLVWVLVNRITDD